MTEALVVLFIFVLIWAIYTLKTDIAGGKNNVYNHPTHQRQAVPIDRGRRGGRPPA